ncbi:MAG TPA: HPr-rel-A system PqqD family peptide chaperone [Allosphingosinicella sp.]
MLLDGLTILYHRPSGMTHILVTPAPEILAALGDAPADPEELLRRICERFEIEAEDAAEAVAARLAELEAAGLVRRA